jgi:hypothetical protein
MATKKVPSKRSVSKAKQPAVKAKPAAGSKAPVKKMAAKASVSRKRAVSISAKPAAVRAAEVEVEVNLGGSRPLTEFLSEIDWYK